MAVSGTGPLGVGIIGAGVISDQYLDNLSKCPDVVVLFIADVNVERARMQAEKYSIAGSGSVESLLSRAEIELVVNLTIPAAHVEIAWQVLAAGKHVWTEKPMALDRASAISLLEEAARLGLRVGAAPDTFLGAGFQAGQRLIEQGAIGTPLTALALFQVPGPESWHPNPDFLYLSGAGPLFDMGPYYITALVGALGPIGRVAASSSVAHKKRTIATGPRAGEEFSVEVPTHVSALIEFEGGASAQVMFSFQSDLNRTGLLEISGSIGTLVFPDPNDFSGDLTLWKTGVDVQRIATTSEVGRGIGVVELARSIRGGVPEIASGKLAYHALDVMVSVIEAAETGGFIEVSSTVESAQSLPPEWDARERTL